MVHERVRVGYVQDAGVTISNTARTAYLNDMTGRHDNLGPEHYMMYDLHDRRTRALRCPYPAVKRGPICMANKGTYHTMIPHYNILANATSHDL
jgi:hypothetical protein